MVGPELSNPSIPTNKLTYLKFQNSKFTLFAGNQHKGNIFFVQLTNLYDNTNMLQTCYIYYGTNISKHFPLTCILCWFQKLGSGHDDSKQIATGVRRAIGSHVNAARLAWLLREPTEGPLAPFQKHVCGIKLRPRACEASLWWKLKSILQQSIHFFLSIFWPQGPHHCR